jgi:hypothetical protein
MTTTNPFRQPLRRGEVDFQTTVYPATAKGKDSSSGSKNTFAINNEYLWIASDFSVPLAWIEGAQPLGPGFVVTWKNQLNGQREHATLCARRLFGYNLKTRDELVIRVNDARRAAKNRPAPSVVASAVASRNCERCGALNAQTHDFVYVVTFLLLFVSKPDRRVVCAHHARVLSALNALSNLVLGSLGIAVIFSPLATLATTRRLKFMRVLSPGAAYATMFVAVVPYLLILAYIAWRIAS